MALVIFTDEEKRIEVKDGTTLQEATEDAGAGISFGCTQGECGACLIEVVDGIENLNPMTEDEDMTLSEKEKKSHFRLACQCHIVSGDVKIKAAEEPS